MFKEFDPVKNKIFRVMDNNGKIINEKWMPKLSGEQLLKAYKDMLFVRTTDFMSVSYQRQGRMFTYPPNLGQEAISQAIAMNWKEDDWFIPAFRELGAWLAKGVSLRDIFLYFMGFEEGAAFKGGKNIMSISVPIASQLPHAVGIGYSIRYHQGKEIVYAVVGDGGTSTGDFHESLNFASVWKVPVVFIIQNNQFAISVPLKMQTNAPNLAIRSVGYGIPGIYADGNDLFAMYKAIEEASNHARQGKGPVLIEALTYRKGAHTTSDDPTKYRSKEEEELWDKTDPLKRLKQHMEEKGLFHLDEEQLIADYKKEIDRQFTEAENFAPTPLADVFNYMYAEMPDDLKNQMTEHENFLKWKEARK